VGGSPAFCADLANDMQNCGGCRLPCGIRGPCASGMCRCTMGLTFCVDGGPYCTDTTIDNSNCGACNFPCPPTTHCATSSCIH
jgi:hypothetical protein